MKSFDGKRLETYLWVAAYLTANEIGWPELEKNFHGKLQKLTEFMKMLLWENVSIPKEKYEKYKL